MTFFNKKEDVISIELTPHGRKLLSKGKLKPAYYAFFDDDILYDSQRGGFTETNSETKARIISETPSMRPQTNYKGVESKIENMRSHETENNLLTPIGTNRRNKNCWLGYLFFTQYGILDDKFLFRRKQSNFANTTDRKYYRIQNDHTKRRNQLNSC